MVVLVLLAGIIAGSWLPERIIVSTSDSLDHRVFFKVMVERTRIEEGDYLLFQLQGAEHLVHVARGLKENDVLIKRVACVPGDLLVKDGEGVFTCNGRELGGALTYDSKGRVLPMFDYNGPIPKDCYFMMGTNPRSYDSRYFGLIHADEFISKALPLW